MISDMHNMFDDRIYEKEAVSLKKAGYSVCHICVGNENLNFVSKDGIQIVQFERKRHFDNSFFNKTYKLLFVKNVYNLIFKEALAQKADIFHFHDFSLIKMVNKIKKKTRKKIIFDAHDPFYQNVIDYNKGGLLKNIFYKLYSKYIQNLEKKYVSGFDKIITTENNLAQYYKNKIGLSPEIIYNYTTFEIANKTYKKEYDFIYCGIITVHRSVFQLLEAVLILKKQKPDVRIVFVGSFANVALSKKVYRYVENNNLQKNVILVGSIPYKEVSGYYKKSKIALAVFQQIPTHNIIVQIKIFEYTTLGLPMIASNFGHIKNYIEKDKTGLLVKAENPNDIAEKMQKLLYNNDLYNKLRRNALKVAPNYQWKIMEEKLLKIYDEILDN